LPPGVVHQDVTHGFGRCGEEVAAAIPVRSRAPAHQAQVRLVDEGGGLESLSGLLVGQFLGGQPAQLIVDQRQDAAGGGRVAVGNSFKKLGDLVHRAQIVTPTEAPYKDTAERRLRVATRLTSKDATRSGSMQRASPTGRGGDSAGLPRSQQK